MVPQVNRKSMKFKKKQIDRYSRQIILKKIGVIGQKKLLESSVLIVGAGGLGSPISIYLTALGVGKVGIIDNYKYSKAMSGHGKEWTFEELNGYLIKPAKWIKGTKMAFAGLRKEKDRASVIKYLNQNSDIPKPLP